MKMNSVFYKLRIFFCLLLFFLKDKYFSEFLCLKPSCLVLGKPSEK